MMKLKITNHARKRIFDRMGVDAIVEVEHIVNNAWNSEERSQEVIHIASKPHNKEKVITEYKDHYFVFGIRYSQIFLITVYEKII